MSKNTKVKLIVISILAVLVLVLVFQNIQEVQTRIFFARLTMPLAGLLALMTGIGFGLGWLVAKTQR